MGQPNDQLYASDSLLSYEFLSEDPKGKIEKLILFKTTNYYEVYNLAFGNINKTTGQIDDNVNLNNGDREMVLLMVVSALYAFTEARPDAWIYATGSSKSRTRLYRMGIAKYLKEIKNDFEVYGLIGNIWKTFEQEIDYDAFLIRRKSKIIRGLTKPIELNKFKVKAVIDKSLNKYDDVILFHESLDKANEMLRTIGLPKLPLKLENQNL